ncbi:type I restriction-modification enzyme R subunit C-terminal domain-containing protein [Kibdelosporangium philippinense]|uniref:type I restriction-modification enzyme R subunit C-terminal domain-containing protein n=1 Tax=Kibdelosporangium philippinense TaxID=211113 RepID=UPI001F231BE6
MRRNRQITITDLEELERIFIESGIGTEAEINRAKANSGGFGLFLRSLTGLDRQAVAAAFSKFQAGKTFTSAQLRFVNEMIDYFAHNGTMTVDIMYQPPFTVIIPAGPEEIFHETDMEAMITTMHSINATAVPA